MLLTFVSKSLGNYSQNPNLHRVRGDSFQRFALPDLFPCIRSNTRNVTDLHLRDMRLTDKTIWIHRPINNTSNMRSSNSETVSKISASGVAPAYNFVESLTFLAIAIGGGKDTQMARGASRPVYE
jgi:hypothetical protein